MRFAVERTGRAVSVIPLDAQPLVRAGRVDRRLFDVTGLVETGYHDEARDSVPLIVRGGGAEEAGYRLEVADTRGGDLTTRLEAAWTFRSSHADERVELPLATVRFTPVLDADNAAPAGRPFAVPVAVEGHQGAVWRLTVEVSYDDGVSWSKAPIRAGWATVQHPAGAGFVSLRASAADAAGNTVTQTLIHAYRLA